MTAPRWIAEAIDAVTTTVRGGEVFQEIPLIDAARLPAALIERLPMEAMAKAALEVMAVGKVTTAEAVTLGMVAAAIGVLADGDPEVVTLTELYQGACRALDAAGAPYETGGGEQLTVRLNLAGRILWLVEQRPTRIDMQRVEAERNLARTMHQDAERAFADAMTERDQARARVSEIDANAMEEIARLVAERDQLQKMYEGAADDLDRERTLHQEDMASRDAEIVKLAAERDDARSALATEQREHHEDNVTEAERWLGAIGERDEERRLREGHLDAIRALLAGEMPAGDLRRALAEMTSGSAADTERWGRWVASLRTHAEDQLRERLSEQAAVIIQLEAKIRKMARAKIAKIRPATKKKLKPTKVRRKAP